MAVICLLTPGQPSTNPRLVKEADALVEAGHSVHVICAHWARWADETDKALVGSRTFSCTYVGGDPIRTAFRYSWTRIRHRIGRECVRRRIRSQSLLVMALSRVSPDLKKAAEQVTADLYIAHNLGALPAAAAAASRNRARLGFDAEDFHSGMSTDWGRSHGGSLAQRIERRILPRCDYVTAAAPLIAERYAQTYTIPAPTTVLNVFPLADRPAVFKVSGDGSPLTLCWFSQTIGSDRGLEDAVMAMGLLKGFDIQLHLLGHMDVGYKEKLDTLAASLGLSKPCVHLHRPVPPHEVIRWCARYDVGLALERPNSLNRNICLTNKIFSYLLAGNAVIGTATEGQKRLLDEIPGAGFSVEPGDANAIAARLKFWYHDRAALNAARHQSWQHGSQTFNWDREKTKFINVVDDALGRRAGKWREG